MLSTDVIKIAAGLYNPR